MLLSLGSLAVLLYAVPALAQSSDGIQFTPEVPIPGVFEETQTVDESFTGKYLSAIYVYFIWGIGILATTMIIFGGVKWVSAAGNPARIADARDVINNAIIGVIIGLVSIVLLNLISPQFTSIGLPKLPSATPLLAEYSKYNSAFDCYETVTCPENFSRTWGGACGGGVVSGVFTYANPGEIPCGTRTGTKGICCQSNDDSNVCAGFSSTEKKKLYEGICRAVTNIPLPDARCEDLTCGAVASDNSCVGVQCGVSEACYLHDGVGECIKPNQYYTYRNNRACNNSKAWFASAIPCGQSQTVQDNTGQQVPGMGTADTCAVGQWCSVSEPVQIPQQGNACGFIDSATRCVSL